MATLEKVCIKKMIPEYLERTKKIEWVTVGEKVIKNDVPHIFFDDGKPWLAANAYALYKLEATSGNNIKTILSSMAHLKAYACWLEAQHIDWRHFPKKKKDRCLFRYRGFLVKQRENGYLSPSTTTSRMAAVIYFYRWAEAYNWIDRGEMWQDIPKIIHFYSSVGFSRTMSVLSSELSIPNRRHSGTLLEGGLFPISDENRKILLLFLHKKGMIELYYMMMIGFFTGARSETIRTLRISTIENAIDDPSIPGIKRILVGPGTKVKTKFDVKGYILFPKNLIEEIENYAYSVRRLSRQSRASENDKTLLFLTTRGKYYSDTSFTKIISYMREKIVLAGYSQFINFKFHQTRATFGTQLMRIAINILPNQVDAIVFVRDAMLHKHESTTWTYIKFIELDPIKEALSEEFFNLYTGLEYSKRMN